MADIKSIAEHRSALLHFRPDRLEVKPGLNARDFTDPENVAHVEEIAASIAANGFYVDKPIAIFQDKDADGVDHVYIADGECRWRAAKRAIELGAMIATVSCVPIPKVMDNVDVVLHRNLSNTGKRFTPTEEAQNIKHAVFLGASEKEIATKLGKSTSYVANMLTLAGADREVQNMVRSGEVAATTAIKLVKEEGNAGATETIKAGVAVAKAQGKKKATAKHLAPLKAKPQGPAPIPDSDVTVYAAAQGVYRVDFGTKIVQMSRIQWRDTWLTMAKKMGFDASAFEMAES